VVTALKEVMAGKKLVEVASLAPGWQIGHPVGPGVMSPVSTH